MPHDERAATQARANVESAIGIAEFDRAFGARAGLRRQRFPFVGAEPSDFEMLDIEAGCIDDSEIAGAGKSGNRSHGEKQGKERKATHKRFIARIALTLQ